MAAGHLESLHILMSGFNSPWNISAPPAAAHHAPVLCISYFIIYVETDISKKQKMNGATVPYRIPAITYPLLMVSI